jgi:hypothetical protein
MMLLARLYLLQQNPLLLIINLQLLLKVADDILVVYAVSRMLGVILKHLL